MTEAGGNQSGIVVGIDRSPSGRAAWSWAAAYSRSRGHQLRAVHVYERPIPPLTWALAPGGTGRGNTSSRDAVRHELEAIFAASGPAPDWQLDFLDGQVGTVLLEQSRSARMLVIGTREHVGVGRIVHGSVSHFCLNNANCPVAAVPPVPPGTWAASVDARPEAPLTEATRVAPEAGARTHRATEENPTVTYARDTVQNEHDPNGGPSR